MNIYGEIWSPCLMQRSGWNECPVLLTIALNEEFCDTLHHPIYPCIIKSRSVKHFMVEAQYNLL